MMTPRVPKGGSRKIFVVSTPQSGTSRKTLDSQALVVSWRSHVRSSKKTRNLLTTSGNNFTTFKHDPFAYKTNSGIYDDHPLVYRPSILIV